MHPNSKGAFFVIYFLSQKQMAMSYDQRKNNYEKMNDTQKQQFNDSLSKKDSNYFMNDYMKQYNNENQTPKVETPTQTTSTNSTRPSDIFTQ
jgi:hypothetical protein